jgi:hypothetical protein
MPQVHSIPRFLIALFVLAMCAGRALSQVPETKEPPRQDDVSVLIDELQGIAEGDVGYMATRSGIGFLPLGTRQDGALLLGQKPSIPSGTMRELVRRGGGSPPDRP